MDTHKTDSHNAPETHELIAQAGVAKAKLPWFDLALKSFIGGVFIALGGGIDLVVGGGSPGLRASNPALVTLISGFTFPTGFVLIILCNVELATSNFFTLAYSTLVRKTTLYDLARNWIVSYIFNMAGALFFAGILCWWSDVLDSDVASSWAVSDAESRVNLGWGYNFCRGIGCNWLVGLAMVFATSGRDNVSKIYGTWIPVWAFVVLGYQHCIANFFLIPIGMFYGTNFGVGKYIYESVIPVTLGNIVGGAFFCGVFFWVLYGRGPALANEGGMKFGKDKGENRGMNVDGNSTSDDNMNSNTLRGRTPRGDQAV